MTLVTGTTIGDAIANAVNALNPMSAPNLATLKTYWEPMAKAILAQGAGGFTSYNIVTVSCAHGVQSSVAHGMPSAPTLSIVLGCDGGQFVQGTPVLADLGSGNIGVTLQYGLSEQFSQIYLTSSAQVFPTASTQNILFGASATTQIGSNITYDGSAKLTAGVAGLYDIRASFNWAGSSAAGSRGGYLYKNNAAQVAVSAFPSGDTNVGAGHSLAIICPLVATDFFRVTGFQDSGGNMSLATSSLNPQIFQMRQIANDSSLTANVTLMLLKQ